MRRVPRLREAVRDLSRTRRGFPHPWPVDPAQYPLNGPSRGTAYMPPERPDDGPTPFWVKAVWAVVACAVFYGVFCAVVTLSASVASALFG